MDKPYTDKCNGNVITRHFSVNVPIGDLVWEKNEKNYKTLVVNGEGWSLQFDNEDPNELHAGEILLIPRNTYYRFLRGYTDLLIEITDCG